MFAVKTRGADSAGFDAVAHADQSYKMGLRFWSRYSAGAGNHSTKSQFKLTKPGEIQALVKAGIDFMANSEWYVDRVGEGATAGKADGAEDLEFWQSRGLAKGSSIYLSYDTAMSPSKYNVVEDYFGAYDQAQGGYYHADGGYLPIPALVEMSKRGVVKHGWIPSAASWSTPDSPLPPGYAPPANSAWDLWRPTATQIDPAIKFLLSKMAGHELVSCIWQTGNSLYAGGADENMVIIAGPLGTHTEALGGNVVSATGPEKWDKADETKFRALVASEVEARIVRWMAWMATGAGNVMVNSSRAVPAASGLPAGTWGWLNPAKGQPAPANMATLNANLMKLLANDVAQTAALKAITENSSITPEQLTQIINDAVANAVVDVDVTVHGDSTVDNPTPPTT